MKIDKKLVDNSGKPTALQAGDVIFYHSDSHCLSVFRKNGGVYPLRCEGDDKWHLPPGGEHECNAQLMLVSALCGVDLVNVESTDPDARAWEVTQRN